jgi:hypothetical protein
VNVQFLINQAIFLSVQDAAFQPDINYGYQEFALSQLNFLLDEWRDKIPFSQQVTFNDVDDLLSTTFAQVDSVQYVLTDNEDNNPAFYLIEKSLNEYKRLQNIIGLTAFPAIYYFDQLEQALEIYPLPSQTNYQFIVRGRVLHVSLGLFDEIPANLPPFMQNAIIHEIAFRLCARYGVEWDAKKENLRVGLLAQLENKKEIDISPDIDISMGTPGITYKSPFPTWFYMSGGGS